jgi:hypothetical protein
MSLRFSGKPSHFIHDILIGHRSKNFEIHSKWPLRCIPARAVSPDPRNNIEFLELKSSVVSSIRILRHLLVPCNLLMIARRAFLSTMASKNPRFVITYVSTASHFAIELTRQRDETLMMILKHPRLYKNFRDNPTQPSQVSPLLFFRITEPQLRRGRTGIEYSDAMRS